MVHFLFRFFGPCSHHFLFSSLDGVNCNQTSDSRIPSNQCGLLITLPASFVSLIELFDLFHITRASGFDSTMSMIAYKRTLEIDSGREMMEYPFLW